MENKNIDFVRIGLFIKRLRESKGLSRNELAIHFNISGVAIHNWETGEGIKTEHLYELANFFCLSVEDLINCRIDDELDYENYVNRFDISNIYLSSDISKDLPALNDYLDRCHNIVSEINYLFPRYLKNTLSKQEDRLFNDLFNNFKFCDDYHLSLNTFGLSCLKTICDYLKNNCNVKTQKELDYELSKIFELRLSFTPEMILSIDDEEIARKYLSLFNQYRKDELLTKIVDEIDQKEWWKSIAIKNLLNNGAKCLFSEKDINDYDDLYFINENDLEFEKTSNDFLTSYYKDVNNHVEDISIGITSYYDPYLWKSFKIDQYEKCINYRKTNLLNLSQLRKDDPYGYLQSLLSGNF